jgi:hypothetical protein
MLLQGVNTVTGVTRVTRVTGCYIENKVHLRAGNA